MSIGLIALLDDVAMFAKVAAASLDDVGLQATKAGSKAAAVVIDDAAVTPGYVVGFSAERELPIIWRIAKASLFNKLIILLPIAVALGYFAPWSVTPLLMIGGSYLCYEGAEKIYEAVFPHMAHEHEKAVLQATIGSEDMENKTVMSAVRTDFILSAEIMAISLSTVADVQIINQIVVLALIALMLTVGVYGVVAFIVKMDDMGLALSRNQAKSKSLRSMAATFGRGLVLAMPWVLDALTILGTAAMTWVGGSIIAHGLDGLGVHGPEALIHHVVHIIENAVSGSIAPLAAWFTTTLLQAFFGIVVGGLMIPIVGYVLVPLFQLFSRKKNSQPQS